MPELALEWVTMDNTFINRASVGGGWSHTYAHACIYSTANTIEKYLIAISCSALLVILYILHNWVLQWMLPLHTEQHWVNPPVAMITCLTNMKKLNYKCISAEMQQCQKPAVYYVTQTLDAASAPWWRTHWLQDILFFTLVCYLQCWKRKNTATGSLAMMNGAEGKKSRVNHGISLRRTQRGHTLYTLQELLVVHLIKVCG